MGATMTATSKFQELIDSIEELSLDEQELLVEIISNHLILKGRSELIAEVAEAREAYKKGEFKQGTVADLMKDMEE
jgi:hypothetical protein